MVTDHTFFRSTDAFSRSSLTCTRRIHLLLFKVAKPEPETRVQERPNPKHRFGNSRPGLDLEGLVCTEVGIKTVSRRGRPNCHASASWTSDKFSLTGTLDTDTRPNCYYLIKYDLT